MEANLQDTPRQPTSAEVGRAARRLREGEDWRAVFPGVATPRLDTTGQGLTFSVRFTREPTASATRILRAGEEEDDAPLIREVDLTDRYSMGLYDIAPKVGLTPMRALALVRHLDLQSDNDCFRVIRVGTSTFKRYSPKALQRLREAIDDVDMDEVWERHRPRRRAE